MEPYISIIILAGIAAAVVVKGPKHDPRFAGFIYGCKAMIIYLAGCLLLALSSKVEKYSIGGAFQALGYLTAIIGFIGVLNGGRKHVKSMFGPVDTRRAVDPNYDVPYTECPHCHKVEVRVTGSKAKCPKCGGVIRADERTNA